MKYLEIKNNREKYREKPIIYLEIALKAIKSRNINIFQKIS
jgi:hypothetical protein